MSYSTSVHYSTFHRSSPQTLNLGLLASFSSVCHIPHAPLLEILVISAPEPEASVEQSTENQAPTPSPSLGGGETGENTLGDEKFNHGNEIITPTDDILPHNPDDPQPTLDNTVKDVLTEPPQAEVEEPGQTNELVEDSTRTTGKMEKKVNIRCHFKTISYIPAYIITDFCSNTW